MLVYYPNYKSKVGLFRMLFAMLKNIVNSRELIWQLFRRDFLMMYKKSFLGLSWLLISPLIGIVSWVFMNKTGIITPGNLEVPYPVFVLLGNTMWGLFLGFYSSSAGTLKAGEGFILQVKYPHESLLVKQALQQLASFGITFAITLLVVMLFGFQLRWEMILLPLVILPLFFIGAAMGLIMSVISTVATDLSTIVNVLLGFVFFITPIVYSEQVENKFLQLVIKYNPLSYLVTAPRDLILLGRIDNFDIFISLSVLSFVAFILALRLFYVSEDKVIEKML